MTVNVAKAPAGSGKTTVIAKFVANYQGCSEVYVESHALATEWEKLILSINPACTVQIIRGRSYQAPGAAPFCQRSKTAEKLSGWGVPVYPNLCSSNTPGGGRCQYFDKCKYINQFGSSNVTIYTHAHLPLERGRMEDTFPSLVVIDESFFQKCIEQVRCPVIATSMSPAFPPDAQALFSELCLAIQQGLPLNRIMSAARGRAGGLGAIIDSLKREMPNCTPGFNDQGLIALRKDWGMYSRVIKILLHIKQAVKTQATPQSVCYDPIKREIVCNIRRSITRFKPPAGIAEPHIIILDADASRTIIERFFPVDVFRESSLPRNAYVIQCYSTRCSTKSLVPAPGSKDKKAKERARGLLQDIQALIDRESVAGKKVLVVGPTAVTGNPRTGKKALIKVPSHCDIAHFNGLRGIDRWKDFDVVIVIGRNQLPMNALEDIASALYFDDPVPLNLSGRDFPSTEMRGYRMRQGKRGVDVEVHPDARVQAVLEQLREGETLQSVDRLRLIHCTTAKRVILLSNIPLDIDVDELQSWDHLMYGNRIEQAFAAAGPVLPLSNAWLAAKFSNLWPSLNAIKKDVQRSIKRGHFSSNTSIGIMSPLVFEYKPAGQRSWSRCLSRLADPPAVLAALEALLGKTVKVRIPSK